MADNSSSTEVFVYTEGAVVPENVVRARVHPSVTAILRGAFKDRNKLEEIELSEGLLKIGEEAFYGCHSLKQITIPSTVRTLGHRAFYNAANISTVHLPDNIQKFGNRYGCEAFSRCYKLANFRMSPRNNSTIPNEIVCMCLNLFSVEISESDVRFHNSNAFAICNSLRNIAIPHDVSNIGIFYRTDLEQLFNTDNEIINALQHRFDNLPVHKMVYYKSYNNITVGQLNNAEGKSLWRRLASMFNVQGSNTSSNKEQDCLGKQQDSPSYHGLFNCS